MHAARHAGRATRLQVPDLVADNPRAAKVETHAFGRLQYHSGAGLAPRVAADRQLAAPLVMVSAGEDRVQAGAVDRQQRVEPPLHRLEIVPAEIAAPDA